MYTDNDFRLYHHGILGQKWGVRNGPPYPLGSGDHSVSEKKAGWKKSLSGPGQGKARTKIEKKIASNKVDTNAGLADIVAVYAVSIVSSYAIIKGIQALEKHKKSKELDKQLRDRKGEIDEATGLHLKDHKYTEIEDLAAVNPVHDEGLSTNMNCTYCSFTYEMRKRGYDVSAELSNKPRDAFALIRDLFPGATSEAIDTYNIVDKKKDIDKDGLYFDPHSNNLYSIRNNALNGTNTEHAKNVIKTMSKEKGTRGVMTLSWAYGGHMVAYDVDKNGKFRILDAQQDRIYEGKDLEDLLSCTMFTAATRLDNVDFNAKTINKVMR